MLNQQLLLNGLLFCSLVHLQMTYWSRCLSNRTFKYLLVYFKPLSSNPVRIIHFFLVEETSPTLFSICWAQKICTIQQATSFSHNWFKMNQYRPTLQFFKIVDTMLNLKNKNCIFTQLGLFSAGSQQRLWLHTGRQEPGQWRQSVFHASGWHWCSAAHPVSTRTVHSTKQQAYGKIWSSLKSVPIRAGYFHLSDSLWEDL